MLKKIMEHILIIKELGFQKKKILVNAYLQRVVKIMSITTLIQENLEVRH